MLDEETSGRLSNMASSVNILTATLPIALEVSSEIGASSGFI